MRACVRVGLLSLKIATIELRRMRRRDLAIRALREKSGRIDVSRQLESINGTVDDNGLCSLYTGEYIISESRG